MGTLATMTTTTIITSLQYCCEDETVYVSLSFFFLSLLLLDRVARYNTEPSVKFAFQINNKLFFSCKYTHEIVKMYLHEAFIGCLSVTLFAKSETSGLRG